MLRANMEDKKVVTIPVQPFQPGFKNLTVVTMIVRSLPT